MMCVRLPDGRVGARIKGWSRPIRDDVQDKTPHGTLDLERGLVVSCNAYFAQLGSYDVGAQALLDTANLLGIAAASPIIDNASTTRTYQPQEPFNIPTLPKALERAKLRWTTYTDPGFSYFSKIKELKGSPHIQRWTKFDTDVAAGQLPNVSWMYAPR
jgi:cell division protein FtsI/penicillin-binding protein 2